MKTGNGKVGRIEN